MLAPMGLDPVIIAGAGGRWRRQTPPRRWRFHPVMAVLGLDPAIGYPHQFANDAIPVSNHPMEMAGPTPAMTWLHAVRQQLGPLILLGDRHLINQVFIEHTVMNDE